MPIGTSTCIFENSTRVNRPRRAHTKQSCRYRLPTIINPRASASRTRAPIIIIATTIIRKFEVVDRRGPWKAHTRDHDVAHHRSLKSALNYWCSPIPDATPQWATVTPSETVDWKAYLKLQIRSRFLGLSYTCMFTI